MFVNFFIDRPIFSTVIALLITLSGAICIPVLPVAQFPDIAPPVVQINTTYTGASAEVVEQTVTTPIEQQVNGVQGMTYINSISGNDGSSTINATFDIGYGLDIAAVDVQNYESFAEPQLPDDVKRYGVTTKKQAVDFILVINLFSNDPKYDEIFLSNYATINIVDPLKRIRGVGNVQLFGERKYSMRVWLDPDKLTSMGLQASDVINAIRNQNIQVAAGSIAAPPISKEYPFQYTILTKGRLDNVEDFRNIVVRTSNDGAVVRVRDVGTVELGAENYYLYSTFNKRKTASIGVFQLPGANSIDIARQVKEIIKDSEKRFPEGIKYDIAYDTTMFVKESIKEVVETLFIAIILVFMVIYIFLQSWRATLIPAITIPVSLIGTFAVMKGFGYSINTLTLFGLVLAIGLVVDDAIVVLENVERIMEHEKLSPKEATKKSMSEVVAPIIATTLVLMAVFIPVSLMPGISGQLYRQFAMTIAISVGISAINALTLSPALCAIFLRPDTGKKFILFEKFNAAFSRFAKWAEEFTGYLVSHYKKVLIGFGATLLLVVYLLKMVPTGFIPDEDAGYLFVLLQGPEGASLERTKRVTTNVEDIVRDIKGVEDIITIGGYDVIRATTDSSFSSLIVVLAPWDERTSSDRSMGSIMRQIFAKTSNVSEVNVFPFLPPAIRGLSTAGGFQFMLEDLEGGDINRLMSFANQIIEKGKKRPELARLSTSFKTNYPQFYIDLDRTKAMTLGIEISDVFAVLQANLGSYYVNDFNKFGKVYRVFVQAKEDIRVEKSDISRLYVRSKIGQMVPLSALVQVNEIKGVQTITHYNLYRSIEIDGTPAPGYSSGQAIAVMEDVADSILPDGYSYEWTGLAYQEIKAGSLAPLIFALAIVFVFLFLSAQYESFSMPLMIMLAVPLAILGALSFQWARGLANDIYCQIGLVTLIGLASKNAILLVEFAKNKRLEGLSVIESALTSIRIRLRPILMTAFAFILGVLPLVFAEGAGAASRHSLGTAVCGGMIVSTFLSIGLVPVLYVVIEGIREKGFKLMFSRQKAG